MKAVAFLVGSLLLILLAVLLPLHPGPWQAAGGLALGALWVYALIRTLRGGLARSSPLRLLPAQAAFFLALSQVEVVWLRAGWLGVVVLAVALDLVRSRSLAMGLYAILWLAVFILLHQVVALARNLSGAAFLAWTAGVALVAVGHVALGTWRIWNKGVMQ